jgi:hypothetical protein
VPPGPTKCGAGMINRRHGSRVIRRQGRSVLRFRLRRFLTFLPQRLETVPALYPVSNGSAARSSLLCRGGDNREASDCKQDGYADSHAHTFEVGHVKGHPILQASLSPPRANKAGGGAMCPLTARSTDRAGRSGQGHRAILTTARLLHQTPRELIFNFADPRLAACGAARLSNG